MSEGRTTKRLLLGYGRYSDDPEYVGCPRAASDMTPCVARDGRTACSDPPESLCVGCGASPSALLGALQRETEREVTSPHFSTREDAAEELCRLVREVTAPEEEKR